MKKCKIVLFVLVSFLLYIWPVYAETVDSLQQKLEDNRDKQEDAKAMRQKAEAESKTIAGNINQLEQQISKVESEITTLNGEITVLEKNIKSKEQEVAQTNQDLEKGKELFKTRIKVMYENNTTSYLAILIESRSLSEVLTKYKILQLISDHDKGIITGYTNLKASLVQQKEQLEQEKSRIVTAKGQRTTAMNTLTVSRSAKQEYLKKVNSDISQYKKMEQELQAQSAEFAKMIKQIQAAQSAQKYAGGIMKWPAPGNYSISSTYGTRIHPVYKTQIFHAGTDIAAPSGASIIAANKGKVIYAQWNDGGYGYCVIIDHGGGITTLYGHCSKLLVKSGQSVEAGQEIAKVGSTGLSTGPHLHFEVRVNGETTDPMKYLK